MKSVLIVRGKYDVYSGLEEAAQALGVTPVAVSLAVKDHRPIKGVELRWAERIFAVYLRGSGEWRIATRRNGNRGWLPIDGRGAVPARDVERVKDITAAWYYENSED